MVGPERRTGVQSTESADQANEYVDAIVQHDAEVAAAGPPPTRAKRSRLPVLLGLLPILIGATAWNLSVLYSDAEIFTPQQTEASGYFSILVAYEEIEAYRDSTGGLPPSLEAIGADDTGLRYAPNGGAYVLTMMVGGTLVSFKDGDDITPLEIAFDAATGTVP